MFTFYFDDYIEIVWKVARSTCAGPVLFSEFSNYVDGGVLCNNPTEQGVAAIKNYHMEKGEKLPISLVVSIGSGVYPEKKIGSVDAQDCLTLTKMTSLKGRVTNLLDLFYTAVRRQYCCLHLYFSVDVWVLAIDGRRIDIVHAV